MAWDRERISRWLNPEPEVCGILERWKEKGFRDLLDRGCGPGRHSMLFAEAGFRVRALDHDRDALTYLSDWADSDCTEVTVTEGDIFRLPFGDGSFDCVLDFHASFHADTTTYFGGLRELRRVLRRGGEAYVTVKSKSDPEWAAAGGEDRKDSYTLINEKGMPHFYISEADIPFVFSGFKLLQKPLEISRPGKTSPQEQVHYHLLLGTD